MKLLREIIGRHLINGKVFEVISRSPKTIVVDADSEQVFVYQTGENRSEEHTSELQSQR